jgi:G patch domain-containing protein 1
MAGHDSDSEDYITVGTPIERELEARAGGSRRPAAVHEPGATKALPVWKQAATDDEGRRRFHGAFTGGFSAGYFNSVGSKEGWAPKAFVSSRGARADAGALRRDARDYMDADELAESEGAAAGALTTRDEYDTFGTAATEAAHAAADRERAAADGKRPAVLPGALFHDLVVPVSDPVGARLLRKMGWRVGKGIGRKGAALTATGAGSAAAAEAGGSAAPPPPPRVLAAVEALRHGAETVLAGDDAEAHDEALGGGGDEGAGPCADDEAETVGVHAEDAAAAAAAQRLRRRRRRWGAVAGALADDVKVEVPPAKRDVHGLGFDPFKGAEEFRALKRSRADASLPPQRAGQALGKRARAGAFGVGVFEAQDEDVYGGGEREETHFEVAPGSDEDEDEAARFGGRLGGRAPVPRLALGAAPARLALGAAVTTGTLPGFVPAAAPEPPPKVFPPPVIPRGWQPFHKFAAPLAQRAPPPPPSGGSRPPTAGGPLPPPPPPPPTDTELALRCDTLAVFVARNGASFEELARTRQRDDPRFGFLFGGPGAEYYAWRCMQLLAAPVPQRPEQRSRPLTAEERGRILGEEPLASAPHGVQLQHGAAPPPGQRLPLPPSVPPPPKGIAAGDRAALLASLGRTFTSEVAPSGGPSAQPLPQAFGLQPGVKLADKFASGGVELPGARGSSAATSTLAEPAVLPPPVRSKEDWAPEPLLCKRFGVPDPYKGRPRPAERRTFRTDTFALPETAQAAAAAAPKFLPLPVAATPATDVAPMLQLLPPPPPSPLSLMAHHTASRGAMPAPPLHPPPPPLMPVCVADSAALADDFFASLGGPAAPADAVPPAEPAVPLLRPSEKPIDLFKAIFEADDDEDDDEDDNGPHPALQEAATGMAAAPGAAAAAAAAGAAAAQPIWAPPQLPSAPLGAAPLSGPFSALAALAKEHEERRRKEKKAKKHAERDRKHKKKSKRHSEHDRAERKSKKHADRKDKKSKKARKGDGGGSASSSSSSSSSDA